MRKKSAIKSDNKSEAASPVYVVCGFLGSGKTTLLIRLLSHFLDRGVRPSVLMNEFGEIDIDGKLMEQAGPVGEALIMTAAGLFVAIPAVLSYNALTRVNRLVLAQLDGFANSLHAYLVAGVRLDGHAAADNVTPLRTAQPR